MALIASAVQLCQQPVIPLPTGLDVSVKGRLLIAGGPDAVPEGNHQGIRRYLSFKRKLGLELVNLEQLGYSRIEYLFLKD